MGRYKVYAQIGAFQIAECMRRYGFFKNKRIVLYDTLIEQCKEPEVVAVLAHELGMFSASLPVFVHIYLVTSPGSGSIRALRTATSYAEMELSSSNCLIGWLNSGLNGLPGILR